MQPLEISRVVRNNLLLNLQIRVVDRLDISRHHKDIGREQQYEGKHQSKRHEDNTEVNLKRFIHIHQNMMRHPLLHQPMSGLVGPDARDAPRFSQFSNRPQYRATAHT